jgi:hypothetical protein
MAYHLSLDRALVVRGLAGPLSFGVMIFGEMAVRYLRFGKRAFQPENERPVAESAERQAPKNST